MYFSLNFIQIFIITAFDNIIKHLFSELLLKLSFCRLCIFQSIMKNGSIQNVRISDFAFCQNIDNLNGMIDIRRAVGIFSLLIQVFNACKQIGFSEQFEVLGSHLGLGQIFINRLKDKSLMHLLIFNRYFKIALKIDKDFRS